EKRHLRVGETLFLQKIFGGPKSRVAGDRRDPNGRGLGRSRRRAGTGRETDGSACAREAAADRSGAEREARSEQRSSTHRVSVRATCTRSVLCIEQPSPLGALASGGRASRGIYPAYIG